MITPCQSRYWAAQLSLKGPSGSLGQLSRSLSNSRVDLNPHQVDGALFAVRSPLSKGVMLADEVGLGRPSKPDSYLRSAGRSGAGGF